MGTMDVERYTGSFLVATAIRPKSASQKQKHLRSNTCGTESSQTVDAVAHPVGLPVNDPRNWAGVPLLSMAASIRKSSGGGGPSCAGGKGQVGHKNWQRHHQHHQPVYLPAYPIHHPHAHHHCQTSHLQGAPLIRVPRHPFQQHTKKPAASAAAQIRRPLRPLPVSQPPDPPLPMSSVKRAVISSPSVMIFQDSSSSSNSGGSSSSSDTCSVTSDEGLASGGSESSLPRIIKPRKRKKLALHQRPANTTAAIADDVDYLLSHQGDPLAEIFQSSISMVGTESSSSVIASRDLAAPPPLLCWPVQQEDDIWCSSASQSSWNSSLSPTWSPSSSCSSPSSASCWPDARVIRRPTPAALSSMADLGTAGGGSASGPELQVSSQLIASPFNGHRDIEIRFFSSSLMPPSSVNIPTSKCI